MSKAITLLLTLRKMPPEDQGSKRPLLKKKGQNILSLYYYLLCHTNRKGMKNSKRKQKVTLYTKEKKYLNVFFSVNWLLLFNASTLMA